MVHEVVAAAVLVTAQAADDCDYRNDLQTAGRNREPKVVELVESPFRTVITTDEPRTVTFYGSLDIEVGNHVSFAKCNDDDVCECVIVSLYPETGGRVSQPDQPDTPTR